MPVVRVNMLEGRSVEKKRELSRRITEAVAEVCEVPADGVHVIFEEVKLDNWAHGGMLTSDRRKLAHAQT